jgi:DNA-binding CsgD family transcriptional regulator
MWGKSEGLSLKNIRPAKLVYVLAYSFELIFYAFHTTFLSVDTKLFGLSPSMLMYIGHILMSLIIMLLWSKRFKHLIYISIATTVLGFLAFMFIPGGIPKLLCAVLTMAGLGGCVTSARCGFAFASNNSERLLGVVLALGGRMILNFLDAILPDGSFGDNILFMYIYPGLALAGLVFCLLRFRESDLEVKEQVTSADKKGLYWAFVIFTVFFALEGYTGFMDNNSFAYSDLLDGVGKLLAIALFVFILLLLKKTIWHTWNLFLVIAIAAAALANLGGGSLVDIPLHLFLGVYEIGWMAVIYILACAQRRFASLKLLKQCTLIFVIISPLTTLSSEVAGMLFPQHIALFSLGYVLVITFAFLMVSPSIFKYLFSAAWLWELHKNDMTLIREKVEETDRFAKYNLTPREKEIATFLLAAKTRRWISAELHISESTVKMHVSNLYKKVEINSISELFSLFGVPEVDELPDSE